MIFLRLFFEFFKIGLFSVGGGMATLPFLYELSYKTGWFSVGMLADMVAISESTPGPIGVNMATYVGYTVGDLYGGLPSSILGAVVCTIGLITPSIIIIIIISSILNKFNENRFVKGAFYGIRPASVALICSALVLLAKTVFLRLPAVLSEIDWARVINYKSAILGIVIFLLILRFKKLHPITFLGISAVAGIALSL